MVAGLGLLLGACYSGFDSDGAPASGEGGDGANSDGDSEGESDGEPGDSDGEGDLEVGPTPMRRLTRAQYVQSTRDLLEIPNWSPAMDSLPDEGLNQEEFQLPNMVAATVTTTTIDYSRYRDAAKEAAALAFESDARVEDRLGCAPSDAGDPCVRDYLLQLAERAWGRAVADDDPVLADLNAIAADGASRLGSVRMGLQFAVASLLQSPEYIYVYPTARADDEGTMDDHSLARMLALAFRDSVPDEELLDLARADALHEPDVLEAQVDRLIAEMIEDPDRRTAVLRFFEEWWSMNVVLAIGKDPEAYPEFDASLRSAMRGEVDAWLSDIVFERQADFREVLISDRAWVNDELAALYGIDGSFGPEHEAVELPANSPRAGLLTTGAFLSVMSHPAQTSPAARGKFISERLLCLKINPPPPTVDTTVPPAEGAETKRERFERHTTDPTCAGCHVLMDPMGLSLESFDGIGRWRATETVVFEGEAFELELDTRGEHNGVPFANAKEMSAVLADDPRVGACVTERFLQHTFGRELVDGEDAALEELEVRLREDGQGFLSLLRATVMHPMFTAIEEGE